MKFYIYTLGCKVNTYESNVMHDLLINNGYEQGSINDSDIYIINTCTVTNTADNKSMKVTRSIKNSNPNSITIVVGCMSQNDYTKLLDLDISIILGNRNKSKIVDYIEKYKKSKKQIIDVGSMENISFECMKLNNFNATRAFVKIEDGCNNFCSYCIIPYTRGSVRSKIKEDVLEEIQALIDSGHKEIVLTGIHTGHYGFEDYHFSDLLSDILKIKDLKRLRISSIEITEINDEVIDIICSSNILVDHMHIPLQSGSNKILKLMNRKYDVNYFINKIEMLRKIRPLISITTDVIVGFPSETDELFDETIETIKQIGFSKLHVFPYSRRGGTPSDLMDNQIPNEIKKLRVKMLIDLSKELEIKYMSKFLNKRVSMLPEIYKNGYLIGHTGNYLELKVEGNEFYLNEEIDVLVTKIDYPYMIGEIVNE